MRSRLVHPSDQQSNAIRSLAVDLCRGLSAVTYLRHDPFERYGTAVGHFRCERLLFHEVGEDAGVRCEAGEGDAEVRVYADYFFLVRGEFFRIPLSRMAGQLYEARILRCMEQEIGVP